MAFQQELRSLSLASKIFQFNHRLCLRSRNIRRFHQICYKSMKHLNSPVKVQFLNFHLSKSNSKVFREKDSMEPSKKELAPRATFFQKVQKKDRQTFLQILTETFAPHDKIRRGHVEFIYAALKYMDDFGVPGDLEVYKKILDVFPKGKMIPKNLIQAEFYHFSRHQDCAIYVLDKMEYSGICPDKEMGEIIKAAFGISSHVYKKYGRMMYWMPKLKNINPYMLPDPLPDDPRELAKLALKKMCVDKRTKIEDFNAENLEDSVDKTWIVSAQAPAQQKLIEEHPEEKALYVEGPTLVWLRKISMSYYVLCADPKIYPVVEEDEDDVSNIPLYMFGDPKPKSLTLTPKSVHEQEDSTIMAMCCTGTSSKDSVLSWIRFLRKSNPKLDNIPVLFKIRTSPSSLVAINTTKDNIEQGEEETAESSDSKS
ncbi:evolutionarily conserved signaling intermediate in Toll pathway, mitochondrial-like [Argiope bruennichi]|uniref:evolutionarily conserved signaling intermediate in Toll pathway, mitochondrial-like n=1 Tax=Argiope bruennichi TaxID=94029 RepID=UPI002493F65E|nr:evolutionarily conserved signaling intermediate in Toll pathway, mitochondrial-like [Argiope bruennichi]XP_055942047.1 evolutionarily conserved signaling intermediate in Toll pathway, mitochondrial-like [Argiope bruennichi]XP_055942048.1 evolutionarily conserved signaling intermediate in Toll pathway, mitochondrial-like [Argiope bruennichi]